METHDKRAFPARMVSVGFIPETHPGRHCARSSGPLKLFYSCQVIQLSNPMREVAADPTHPNKAPNQTPGTHRGRDQKTNRLAPAEPEETPLPTEPGISDCTVCSLLLRCSGGL